jgi:hypothetical protein
MLVLPRILWPGLLFKKTSRTSSRANPYTQANPSQANPSQANPLAPANSLPKVVITDIGVFKKIRVDKFFSLIEKTAGIELKVSF